MSDIFILNSFLTGTTTKLEAYGSLNSGSEFKVHVLKFSFFGA